jgi:hypothetical protein
MRLARLSEGGPFSPDMLIRNASGDRVYLQASAPSPGELLVLSVKDVPHRLKPPGFLWALGDDLKFAAWREGDGLRFATGEWHQIPGLGMPPGVGGSSVRFSPGAGYYFVARGSTTELFSLRAPGKLLVRANLFARSLFTTGSQLVVFGYESISGDPAERNIRGEIYDVSSTVVHKRSVRVPRRRSEASPFFVVDFDPRSNVALCEDVHDIRDPEWLLYELAGDRLTSLGPALTLGVFLDPELVRMLYASIQPGN